MLQWELQYQYFFFLSFFIKDINNSQSGAHDPWKVVFPKVEKLAALVVGCEAFVTVKEDFLWAL